LVVAKKLALIRMVLSPTTYTSLPYFGIYFWKSGEKRNISEFLPKIKISPFEIVMRRRFTLILL
jgi:hypothetical protein